MKARINHGNKMPHATKRGPGRYHVEGKAARKSIRRHGAMKGMLRIPRGVKA